MPAAGWMGLSLSRGAELGMSFDAWKHEGKAVGSMCRGPRAELGLPQ